MADNGESLLGQEVTEEGQYFNGRDYDIWDFGNKMSAPPVTPPKLCIYCSTAWTPRMETIFLESGYCETCYDLEPCHVVVCDHCNKIVYKK